MGSSVPISNIRELLDALGKINQLANELHYGVGSLRSHHTDPRPELPNSPHKEVCVLLEVIVDSLEASFSMLFDAARQFSSSTTGQLRGDRANLSYLTVISRHAKEIRNLLRTAKNRLIAEADEITHDKGLGPVVSPEAIIIMLLERLSRGVYSHGFIDVMDIYEKIVERIVRASDSLCG